MINNCFVSMNQNDFIQYNSNGKVMKMYWSKSEGTLWDTYTVLHKSYGPRFVCLYFGAWIATVLIKKIYWAARIFIKNLFLCSAVESQAGLEQHEGE